MARAGRGRRHVDGHTTGRFHPNDRPGADLGRQGARDAFVYQGGAGPDGARRRACAGERGRPGRPAGPGARGVGPDRGGDALALRPAHRLAVLAGAGTEPRLRPA
ncbi:hypothetical protein FRACA_1070012 [Frankia canadensis]|uniref:Uncharacterized protein n=1 Tax=Frankia canadensis TaxID=1836972 RepID=A0A2I2KJ39_9ACTN|nr:hypothetical protein FRACA_1070012 [Frankia canadensis]SOU52960.1 hypothetical protein FRACA_1070012 [Frankia canadensis]